MCTYSHHNCHRDGGKTAYEMFLEDDGPYSRKLYPPLTPGGTDIIQRSQERVALQSRANNNTALSLALEPFNSAGSKSRLN